MVDSLLILAQDREANCLTELERWRTTDGVESLVVQAECQAHYVAYFHLVLVFAGYGIARDMCDA